MANAIYRRFRQRQQEGAANTDLSAGNIKTMLVATSGVATPYTFDQDDEFVSAIDASARISTSPNNLSTKDFTNGLFDADDQTGANGHQTVSTDWQAIVVFVDTGNPATDRLVSYHDTGFTPPAANGSNVDISFPSGIDQF